jgi:hypothetical protein
MVVRMTEDQRKEEAKQKLRFFKNGKDKTDGETTLEPEISAPQAVATEDAPAAKAGAGPVAAKPGGEARETETAAQKPKAKTGDSKARAHELEAESEESGSGADDPSAGVEERKASAEEPGPADAPARDVPGDGAPRSRRRERVQSQESEPESNETLMSHLLPSLTLGFRTLVILAIIVADAFAAYMLTTKVIAPKLIESKVVDLRAEIGQLPPGGGVLPAARPPKPLKGQDIVVNPS